jgi:hypothetical protein
MQKILKFPKGTNVRDLEMYNSNVKALDAKYTTEKNVFINFRNNLFLTPLNQNKKLRYKKT